MEQPDHSKTPFCLNVSHPPERCLIEKIIKYSIYFFTVFFVLTLINFQVLALEDDFSSENVSELYSVTADSADSVDTADSDSILTDNDNSESVSDSSSEPADSGTQENCDGSSADSVSLDEVAESFSEESEAASAEDSNASDTEDADFAVGKTVVFRGKKKARIFSNKNASRVIAYISKGQTGVVKEESGKWYRIQSGKVNGYVLKKYFVLDSETKNKSDGTWQKMATVKKQNTRLYKSNKTSATVLCVLPRGYSFKVLKKGKTFSRVYVEGVGKGWVLNSKVSIQTERKHAVSISTEKRIKKLIRSGIKKAKKIEKLRKKQRAAALRKKVCAHAAEYVGVLPYVSGCSDLNYGVDCSGFTSAVYRDFGITLDRTPAGQAANGKSVALKDIEPGDIVYYSGHVGLYVGKEKIIHAPTPGRYVSYADIDIMPIIKVVRYINA